MGFISRKWGEQLPVFSFVPVPLAWVWIFTSIRNLLFDVSIPIQSSLMCLRRLFLLYISSCLAGWLYGSVLSLLLLALLRCCYQRFLFGLHSDELLVFWRYYMQKWLIVPTIDGGCIPFIRIITMMYHFQLRILRFHVVIFVGL